MGAITITVLRPVDPGPRPSGLKALLTRGPRQSVAQVQATIIGGIWSCPDERFLEVLQAFNLPSGYHPDPDLELATLASSTYAGTVQDTRSPAPAPPDGTCE